MESLPIFLRPAAVIITVCLADAVIITVCLADAVKHPDSDGELDIILLASSKERRRGRVALLWRRLVVCRGRRRARTPLMSSTQ
jgi:hypothetical protein